MNSKVQSLTDDELRAAVLEASRRFGSLEVAGLAQQQVRSHVTARQFDEFRELVAGFPEQAAAAGFVRSGSGLIHVWDCPTVRRVVEGAERWVEMDDAVGEFASGYFPRLPDLLTQSEARAIRARSRAKKLTCSTCCPDI